jgi:hypothetical protein
MGEHTNEDILEKGVFAWGDVGKPATHVGYIYEIAFEWVKAMLMKLADE